MKSKKETELTASELGGEESSASERSVSRWERSDKITNFAERLSKIRTEN